MEGDMDPKDLTDHDLLITMSTDICWLKTVVGNHLKHHWAISICALGATLSAITAVVILLLQR